jgi:serine protease SohB
MRATQVEKLREEVTAILNICEVDRGDRVIIQLNSGGGTVTGYGKPFL